MSESLEARLERVRRQIARAAARAGRDPQAITLIAVTKTVDIERIGLALQLGLHDVGENRVQEALPKMDALAALGGRWHLIGHLQTNKVKFAGRFAMVQSVDSVRLVESLDRHLTARLDVLLEVNVAEEANKTGALPQDVPAIAGVLDRASHLRWRGLMTIAPLVPDPEQARPVFQRLRAMRDDLVQQRGRALAELSMGMTDDFPIAVEEGATMLRLGRALFGARPS